MSWQGYVDNELLGTGMVSQGAIYGLNGDKLAASPDFELQDSEFEEIVAAYSDPSSMYDRDLRVNGVTYIPIHHDDGFFSGKMGTSGVCIAKTAQTILVGVCEEPIELSTCGDCVDKLAKYLIYTGC